MQKVTEDKSNGAPAALRFWWLRESLPGQVEQDAGLRIQVSDLLLAMLGLHPAQQPSCVQPTVTLDTVIRAVSGATPAGSLPDWVSRKLASYLGPLKAAQDHIRAVHRLAQLDGAAKRVIEATRGVSGEPAVYLPYVDRREWKSVARFLDESRFEAQDGRILPNQLLRGPEEMSSYVARWLAAESVHPSPEADLHYRYSKQVTSLLPGFFIAPTTLPRDSTSVEVDLKLPATACRGWNSAPSEKIAAYFPVHSQVSMAVQAALRRWIAFECLDSVETFEDTAEAYAVLVYCASQPFPGRRRTDFTYDTMRADWTRPIFLHARVRLKRLLRTARKELLASGLKRLAGEYYPQHSREILHKVGRQRRHLQALIAAEGDVVNHLLRFGAEIRAETNARRAADAGAACAKALAIRLRHYYRDRDLTRLCPIILFEATNALNRALGQETEIRVSARAGRRDSAPAPV